MAEQAVQMSIFDFIQEPEPFDPLKALIDRIWSWTHFNTEQTMAYLYTNIYDVNFPKMVKKLYCPWGGAGSYGNTVGAYGISEWSMRYDGIRYQYVADYEKHDGFCSWKQFALEIWNRLHSGEIPVDASKYHDFGRDVFGEEEDP